MHTNGGGALCIVLDGITLLSMAHRLDGGWGEMARRAGIPSLPSEDTMIEVRWLEVSPTLARIQNTVQGAGDKRQCTNGMNSSKYRCYASASRRRLLLVLLSFRCDWMRCWADEKTLFILKGSMFSAILTITCACKQNKGKHETEQKARTSRRTNALSCSIFTSLTRFNWHCFRMDNWHISTFFFILWFCLFVFAPFGVQLVRFSFFVCASWSTPLAVLSFEIWNVRNVENVLRFLSSLRMAETTLFRLISGPAWSHRGRYQPSKRTMRMPSMWLVNISLASSAFRCEIRANEIW